MKIYNVINKIYGLGNNDFDYEAVYESGRTAGYDSGYTDAYEKCHHDYSKDALTFEILSAGTIQFTGSGQITPIMYSLDNGLTWQTFPMQINVSPGDVIKFKGNNTTYSGNTFMGSSARFKAYGNIMSLVQSDGFEELDTLTGEGMFRNFLRNTGIYDAENLVLPATQLASSCYAFMFAECHNLITAPELPATELTYACYSGMFSGTSLTTAPELPATSLTESCYSEMFNSCTSLTKAPELPATTLAKYCYIFMFVGCTSLTKAPELPATTLATSCYSHMFDGCTSLTKAPTLPATELTGTCYLYMFLNCLNLNYVKCLAREIPEWPDVSWAQQTEGWLLGVSQTGTFVKNPDLSDWPTGESGIPEGWTVVDAE